MGKAVILSELDITFDALMQLVSTIDEDQFNAVPFPGSWTAGQLVKHLDRSHKGFLKMINGRVIDSEREPDLLAETIKADFLDFSTKTTSPDFVLPPQANYQKTEMMLSMAKIREELCKAVELLDLSKKCIDFEIPHYGFLTRLEAIVFVIYHTQRHNHQLKKIIRSLSEVA
ncbi:hypothetical protein BH23BAC1_BH23BAC1_24510 [soil metagenome]